jgi:4-hydroxybenzoate polyprenyltransferase
MVADSPTFATKWWTYQKERFPVFSHGIPIAAFSFSAVSFSALLRGSHTLPDWPSLFVAFLNSFFAFLHLRIADEFKDIDEDTLYRPYRPVPRGLVTLRELGWLGLGTAAIQLLLALALHPPLVILLLVTWTYLALMSREFFAREWLKARPFTYLWTHMLIMPLIDFYATACDWLHLGLRPPPGLFWFVIVSFFNGIVIEIGRKIRAPEDEENGVPTYTVIWGRTGAVIGWFIALSGTTASAIYASSHIDFAVPVSCTLAVLLSINIIVGVLFLRTHQRRYAKLVEPLSGLWTLSMYLSLGAVPMLWRVWHAG